MTIKGVKDIYVGSYYKPTENDEKWSSLSKIPQNSSIYNGYYVISIYPALIGQMNL